MWLQFRNITQGPGTDSFTNHSLEILLMLLVSFLLGYFLGKWWANRYKRRIEDAERTIATLRKKNKDLEAEVENSKATIVNLKGTIAGHQKEISNLKTANAELQKQIETNSLIASSSIDTTEIDTLRSELGECQNELISLKNENEQLHERMSSFASIEEEVIAQGEEIDLHSGTDSDIDDEGSSSGVTSGIIFGRSYQQNDLKIIEGIGPKTAKLLEENGINSWNQLSRTPVEKIQDILRSGGSRFTLLNPGTWPKQAELADNEEWEALKEYQDYLVGGVEPDKLYSNAVPVLNFNAVDAAMVMGITVKPDDLKIIEGIGPKIDELLNNAGITSWYELSQASVTRLSEILHAAGERFQIHDPGTWPKQAELAYKGNWEELKAYQDYLDKGKDPSNS